MIQRWDALDDRTMAGTSVALLPIIVVLMMIIVGMDIPRGQLTAAVQMPRALGGATLAQVLILPLLAALLVALLGPSPAVAGGLLLVAVSPGGGMSNYYCALGRLNVAFSVLLTTVSGLLAAATMPLLFAAAVPVVLGVESFGVPVAEIMGRLLLFLLLPVAFGIVLRHRYTATIERFSGPIRGFGLGLLLAFLTLIFIEERVAVTEMFTEAVTAIVLFTVLALLSGWASGSALRLDRADRVVVAIEFATRNVGIAALLALITLQQPEFAAFGALFLLFQAPVLLLALLLGPGPNPNK